MAQLSEGEKQFLDDALSTLDDLYEVTPDGGFTSEQMEAIAKLAEEAMGACCLCWTRKCMTRCSATARKRNWGAKLGRSEF